MIRHEHGAQPCRGPTNNVGMQCVADHGGASFIDFSAQVCGGTFKSEIKGVTERFAEKGHLDAAPISEGVCEKIGRAHV